MFCDYVAKNENQILRFKLYGFNCGTIFSTKTLQGDRGKRGGVLAMSWMLEGPDFWDRLVAGLKTQKFGNHRSKTFVVIFIGGIAVNASHRMAIQPTHQSQPSPFFTKFALPNFSCYIFSRHVFTTNIVMLKYHC